MELCLFCRVRTYIYIYNTPNESIKTFKTYINV